MSTFDCAKCTYQLLWRNCYPYCFICNFSLFLLGLLKLHWNSILEGRVRFPGCGFNGTCHQIKATLTVDQLEHRLYRDTSGNDTSSSPAMEQEPPQFKDHLYKDTLRNGTSSNPVIEQKPPLQ
ncbi:uncharacterized protein LOC112906520 isoform X2 [Agrilus planipennis]|uniref:Uncharacterized protein LOC112906520 isoform X2 n=1 Tax=Agrilus planipennis TaxID=224129 RepID=A0A7F5RKT3_AGRPL|nr:uncharacterized protein LOC112906520 isoform X2 [Agrilus planipennis]